MNEDGLGQANRFVIVVGALIAIFIALLLVLLAWGAPADSIARVSDLAGYLRDHDNREAKTIITLGTSVIVLLMLTVIIVELTPSPTQSMRVRNMKSGAAAITTTQIAERVDAEVRQVPHVADCRSAVAARGKRVEVVLDLHVDPGADLALTADAACSRAHALIAQELGIELASRPRARLHYRELRLRGDANAAAVGTHDSTGWERPHEETIDERRSPDASEEAQA